jgi:hypothetical protein
MSRFAIGIDLGTSNCAMASVDLTKKETAKALDIKIEQVISPGEFAAKPLLPSVAYLPLPNEFPAQSTELSFLETNIITGEFPKAQAAKVPQRAVLSAKSWLIHAGVDRQAKILPWGSESEIKISPVEASSAYLKHLAAAWNHLHPTMAFHEQEVVITIPASFDESARALTLQAARDAGYNLKLLTLIEEPQAAFYDFISRHRKTLTASLGHLHSVLVVDVGGGTTDFSLVHIGLLPEGVSMRRVAVGEHLLLGGDNMDAALARLIESKIFPDGQTFNATQWSHALAAARMAKEKLLAKDAPLSNRFSLLLNPGQLVGGAVSVELTSIEVQELMLEGFFPEVVGTSGARLGTQSGVVELGLPYVSDPAITRQLVTFLSSHAEVTAELPRPDAILLNGGVFKADALAEALVTRVSALWPNLARIPLLPHDSLDLAVARGAAYSALARRDLGQKIGGGAPRAFYVEVAGGQVQRAVCLVPRGLEEGETVNLTAHTFQLKVGTPVQFQLYTSTADTLHAAGEVVSVEGATFRKLPPLHAVLKGGKGQHIAVHLSAHLSEVGTLALSCVSPEERFRLEFELKGSSQTAALHTVESMPPQFSQGVTEIERVFGTKPLPVEPKHVKQLFRTLESLLGPRETWRLPVLRELWTALMSGVSKRRRGLDHERLMLQLLGYTLRPGFGYPLDAWRCEETFRLFKELVTHHHESPVWAEFFVLWRRLAPGLSASAHQDIWNFIKPHWQRKVPIPALVFKEKIKGPAPLALDEMVRAVACLEWLPVVEKTDIGQQLLGQIENGAVRGGAWVWAVGRLGARVPTSRAADHTVSSETAQRWVERLLRVPLDKHDGLSFALVQLARKTGDRVRDVDENTRRKVVDALLARRESSIWISLVNAVVNLEAADEARVFGDSLPMGLSWSGAEAALSA